MQFKNTRLGLSLRSGTLAMQVNDHDYNDQNGGDNDGRGNDSNDH